MGYVRLTIAALLPIIFSLILYLLNRRTRFGTINPSVRQIIIGLVFGVLACFSTMFSVEVGGAATNARDAAPLCAGLIFGAPAGLIAGFVGGIFRWFATPLFNLGAYTRIGCSIATCIAGVVGALLRKFMFDDKRPKWVYGLATGISMEVLHMLLIFLTNMNDIMTAFSFVTKCAPIMITLNAFSIALAIHIVSRFDKNRKTSHIEEQTLSTSFQRKLLIVVLLFFVISSIFTALVQNRLADENANSILELSVHDVEKDIHEASDENLVTLTVKIAKEIDESRGGYDFKRIIQTYDVSEINLVNGSGIITDSSNPDFLGFDMASGEQSAEFLVLLQGKRSYVQPYQPISYDATRYMKYAGVRLAHGGFVQVGYNADQFQKDIASLVDASTANRHIESGGCIMIADSNGKIVSDLSGHFGSTLENVGLVLDDQAPGERFRATVHGLDCYAFYITSEGYYIVASVPVDEIKLSGNTAIYVTIFMEIVIFSVLFICVYILIKKLVVDNIHSINESLDKITNGNLNEVVNVRSNYEFASLSDDINSTVSRLKDYIAEAAARIDRELEFAKSIQLSAMPGVFPPFPDRKEFDIFARMDTAKEVGGDFYDFYFVDQDVLAILIADVSGKGIPAAMFMMTAKTVIKSYAQSGLSPEEVFTKANAKLCEGNDAGMFVTAWIAYVNVKTGDVRFANAGHNPPLLKRRDGRYEYLKSRAGLVLAGMEGIKYRPNELKLEPGDEIYLYTDGVTEATDANNELYGEDRLAAILGSTAWNSSEELCAAVKTDVDTFVGEAPQFDDMTMLSLRLLEDKKPGKGDDSSMNTADTSVKEFVTDSAPENVEAVTDFINAELEAADCGIKAQTQIDVAIDEIFSNISKFAYGDGRGLATVTIGIDGDPKQATICFIDEGTPYDPLSAEDPDITLSAEDRQIGGLGIFLVKKTMDDVRYEYRDGHNVLTIIKTIA